jgi:UDP-N-acetylmuramyl-tripeptide synthetase
MEIKGFYQASVSELAASVGVYAESEEMVLRLVTSIDEIESGDALIRKNISDMEWNQALQKGCVAVFCENGPKDAAKIICMLDFEVSMGILMNIFYQSPSSDLKVIAVTGTNGKTTVSYLCAKALQNLHHQSMYIGTLGYGRVNALIPQSLTTPGCGELHHKLALARDEEIECVALEASSQGLDQGRLSGVMIDVAVFTNLTHEHMDYHGSINDYMLAKEKLLMMKSVGLVVINQDDPSGKMIMDRIDKPLWPVSFEFIPRGYSRWSYGIIESVSFEGMQVKIITHQKTVVIDSPLFGSFNAENLILAHAALCQLGIDAKEAAYALSTIDMIPGRMQRLNCPNVNYEVIVDYSHTPAALEKVLILLRSLAKGRLWVVFGCGGDRDTEKRSIMGGISERYADEVVITEDNSRSESFEHIASQIVSGMKVAQLAKIIPSRVDAIKYALREAQMDDIILVAGKGHECMIDTQKGVQEFSDVMAIETALAE